MNLKVIHTNILQWEAYSNCMVWLLFGYTKKKLCASQFQSRAIPLPRANSVHLLQDESRGPDIWQLIVSPSPGICKQQKNLFRNILSPFLTALRVKGFKQSSTVVLELGEEHLSTIKYL